MIYVAETIGPNGGRATKEYEAASIRGAIMAAEHDLREFPQSEIVNIQLRIEWEMPVAVTRGSAAQGPELAALQ